MRFLLALGLAVLSFTGHARAAVNNADAKSILEQVQKNVTSKDEVGTLKMTIVEADGTKKDRTIEIRRKGGEGKQKVLVRLQAPADLKGTALLSVNKGKESDQWLYLPSSKQTRRIQSGKRSAGFLDSELSYEDMGSASDTKVASKVLREEKLGGKSYAVIQNDLTGESSYGKVLVWVDLGTYLVGKTEIYDKAGKLLKETALTDYKQFGSGAAAPWRAQRLEVKNVQNKRSTKLELSGLKLNQGLSDEEFTESALTEGD
ncbi:MAG: outer membrane lipoprotein-sorting protein [Proteobacteria bacterium]|nr:MAG: outer membrane lipoprotein-sorting protein [Pseudomonadota bacterium]